MTTDLSVYARMARAFQIFDGYNGEQGANFYYDDAYAGPDPAIVSAEHLTELEALGWHPDVSEGCLYIHNQS